MIKNTLIIRHLGLQDYSPIWHQMRDFTIHRDANTPDELWLLEHNPVFTQGTNGKPEHILNPGDIPIIQTDRGGQVTYHGPGQLIAYPLLNLKRRHLSISQLVTSLETLTIQLLAEYGISAKGNCSARGVYVGPAKIASIGLRVKKGCCYHGLALNVAMDITPFSRINPCGYPDLTVTQIKDIIPSIEISDIRANLIKYFRLLPSMANVHIEELY